MKRENINVRQQHCLENQQPDSSDPTSITQAPPVSQPQNHQTDLLQERSDGNEQIQVYLAEYTPVDKIPNKAYNNLEGAVLTNLIDNFYEESV